MATPWSDSETEGEPTELVHLRFTGTVLAVLALVELSSLRLETR